jgi:hypothetical protein
MIIDAVCNLWTPEVMASRPEHLNAAVRPFYERYLGGQGALLDGLPMEAMVEEMDASGIDQAFLVAPALNVWRLPYEQVKAVIDAHPGRFHGLAGISPDDRMPGVRRLEFAVKELGFAGAHLYPHWFNRPPNHKDYYPFYAKCVELGVPIQIQIGHSAQPELHTVAHPMTLDEVAIYFPELRIIGIHIGWPWVREAIAVALKHANVFLACDAHAPKYWDAEFVAFLRSRGRSKVLFGTDFPIIGFRRAVEEIGALELPPESLEALYAGNVRRVYGLG